MATSLSKLQITLISDLSQTALEAALVLPEDQNYQESQALQTALRSASGGESALLLDIPLGALSAQATVTPSGLQDGDTVTVAGTTITARTSPTLSSEFAIGLSDQQSAQNLVEAIETQTALQSHVTAYVNDPSTALLLAVPVGTLGNGQTLASSNSSRMQISGATLTGGANGVNKRYKLNLE